MDTMIDSLNKDMWAETTAKADGYKEYTINRQHKRIDKTTLGLFLDPEEGDSVTVQINDTLDDKDPLKNICRAEFKLDPTNTKVIGIDLDGDIVERKS
uniref:AMP-1 n=1 Tax=Pinctada imbricata TaxID=66713 RepID=A0A514YC29_PINIB|nr:AMP-1 [Pinctada imbricata]